MEKRIMIDLLSHHERIIEIKEIKKIDYQFVNILYYVKEKYGISVISLSKLFNVTRQSIYNYFEMNSSEIPKNIIEQVVEVYGEISFEQVLDKECLVEYETIMILPLIYESGMHDDTFIADSSGDSYISKISEVFKPAFYNHNDGKGYVTIKQKYNFSSIWKSRINEISKIIQKDDTDKRIVNLVEQLKETHSKEYLYLLLKIIQDRVSGDDDEFFIYLTKYIKGGNNERS
ncbi:MAG: hypothetical protein RBQ97_07135 [Acholeplasma sp.]|nr:hypothetical protein [Acholeplasma sp.]